ncbi:uncharacterized protein HD556DRAFT_1312041 [Suillus plorans]|uniref:Uncharacterized protein n=1 Tax=Suillus plorans TaxID=116603 RepID=A0A9P7AFN0_9AGAM|nr:uncharacterized protein HD556DRAFT_1312041 [Suillus plorans]KAG1788452.1 hypothetical protein HD556DRAFT_1312041 [Suillus plorans]
MSDDADKIKLELPSKLQAFSFTFETKRPGPMTVEITLRQPTKRPRLLQVPEHVDLSATESKTPDQLQVMHWQEAQKYKLANHTNQYAWKKSAAGTVARIDTEETFDSSDTEKETLAEFTRWYKAKKAVRERVHKTLKTPENGVCELCPRGTHYMGRRSIFLRQRLCGFTSLRRLTEKIIHLWQRMTAPPAFDSGVPGGCAVPRTLLGEQGGCGEWGKASAKHPEAGKSPES